MNISRKKFIRQLSLLTIGLTSFTKLAAAEIILNNQKQINLKLIKDPKGIIDLPKGFTYKIISQYEDTMNDGLFVPNAADGMACFKGSGNNIILIRNHELGHFPILENVFKVKDPLGKGLNKFIKKNKNYFYDIGDKKTLCFGGTTTIVYNQKSQKIKKQYLSLAGTLVNCSGGITPWGSWISCEETVRTKKEGINKNHGYCFEVYPSENIKLNRPIPLKAMGRFRHEAICVDSKNNFIYETEDREDGLFYRFIPNVKEKLAKGGKLQALSLKGFRGTDCSNWKQTMFKVGQKRIVKWINLEQVDNPNDDIRKKGKNKGCASFTRNEGLWFDGHNVFFTSTNGGKDKLGQIWRYKHIGKRGVEGELELFFESNNEHVLNMPDNLIVSPWGDLILSEDHIGYDRLVGIKPDGSYYHFAKNVFNKSEFSGAVFSPDGQTLFLNIYKPTMTFAINGPWGKI